MVVDNKEIYHPVQFLRNIVEKLINLGNLNDVLT